MGPAELAGPAAVAERLLAHHTGDMPADLVYLPYRYLLDTLSDPQQVRENIVSRVLTRQHLTVPVESGKPSIPRWMRVVRGVGVCLPSDPWCWCWLVAVG
jgi:hypothetical protein